MELYRIVVALFYKDVAPHGAGICCGIVLQRCRPSRGPPPLPQKRRRRGISVETTAKGISSPVGRHRPDDAAPMELYTIVCGIVLQRCRPSRGWDLLRHCFYKDVAPHGAGICYGIVSTKMSPLTGLGFVVAL